MKISIIHNSIINLGERGETRLIAIEPKENETINELVERILMNTSYDDSKTPIYTEHIEIRIVKENK